jgi:hypothetical protein
MSDTAMQFPHDSEHKTPDTDHVLAGYMTAEELAGELGMAVITLAIWRMRQKGPPYVAVGRKILYSRTTVKEWIASQVHKPLQRRDVAGNGGQ